MTLRKKVKTLKINVRKMKISDKEEDMDKVRKIKLLKINSSDKVPDVKNYVMDDVVKLIKKKEVITVDSKFCQKNERK